MNTKVQCPKCNKMGLELFCMNTRAQCSECGEIFSWMELSYFNVDMGDFFDTVSDEDKFYASYEYLEWLQNEPVGLWMEDEYSNRLNDLPYPIGAVGSC